MQYSKVLGTVFHDLPSEKTTLAILIFICAFLSLFFFLTSMFFFSVILLSVVLFCLIFHTSVVATFSSAKAYFIHNTQNSNILFILIPYSKATPHSFLLPVSLSFHLLCKPTSLLSFLGDFVCLLLRLPPFVLITV